MRYVFCCMLCRLNHRLFCIGKEFSRPSNLFPQHLTILQCKLGPGPQYNVYGLKICPNSSTAPENILWRRRVLVWNKWHYVPAHVVIQHINLIIGIRCPAMRGKCSGDVRRKAAEPSCGFPRANPGITWHRIGPH